MQKLIYQTMFVSQGFLKHRNCLQNFGKKRKIALFVYFMSVQIFWRLSKFCELSFVDANSIVAIVDQASQ